MEVIAASDPHFRYEGRFDFSDPAKPVVIWEASRISIDFQGSQLAIRFGKATGQVFFDASVDGSASILELREGMPGKAVALAVSGPGLHHLTLFKRTEATAGVVPFLGIEVAPGARVFSPAPPAYRMRIEIFGDSMTVGACDEDGAKDQWDDRRTHDAAFSWAALTSAAFSADYRNISVSGIGLATGYVDVLAGQVWDKTYPTASSPRADLNGWVPDVILVLLGDNDDSYPRDHHLPFPGNFVEKYVSYVRAIRAACPKVPIVLLNGGMWAGTHSRELGLALGTAVTELEAGDPGTGRPTIPGWQTTARWPAS
jgi:lysophospholipase L1-like esterase